MNIHDRNNTDDPRAIDFDRDLFRVRGGVVFLNLHAATEPENLPFWQWVLQERDEEIGEAFPGHPADGFSFLVDAVAASAEAVGGMPVMGLFVDKTAATSEGWVKRLAFPDA